MQKFVVRDTVLLSGWLFADLLLGLMVIFLASIPGIQPRLIPPPALKVSVNSLGPTSKECKATGNNYQCMLTVSETSSSEGSMTWHASTDMTQTNIAFAPLQGQLTPGGTATAVTISNIPCQTGSFTFAGSRSAQPVPVFWKCALEPLKLDLTPKTFTWTVDDYNAVIAKTPAAVNQIQNDAYRGIFPVHRRVGLILVYGGAPVLPDDVGTAQNISDAVSDILIQYGQRGFAPLHDAVRYKHLFNGGSQLNTVEVDVFFFNR
ncbi:hypothetical protein ccbrp13_04450 [Ktedonobacteria bacterium brp13]|nr:hypothetical protein ccbrp13_04450 [Ktedonobacteria bacterium brp13]